MAVAWDAGEYSLEVMVTYLSEVGLKDPFEIRCRLFSFPRLLPSMLGHLHCLPRSALSPLSSARLSTSFLSRAAAVAVLYGLVMPLSCSIV